MPIDKLKSVPNSHAVSSLTEDNVSSLKSRFDVLTDELQLHRAHGAKVIDCPQCSYPAAIEEQGFAPIYFSHCLVCRTKVRYIKMTCICGISSIYDGAQFKSCKGCGEPFSFIDIVKQNEPKVCGEETPDHYEGAIAQCHVCRKSQDSVFQFDEQWLCLNCLEEHRAPGCCEECSTVQTGDLEDSFEAGCMVCAGRVSWD